MKQFITTLTIIALIMSMVPSVEAKSSELTNLFYYYPTTSGYESLKKNYRDIDIFAPQLYSVGYDLELSGPSKTDALTFAKKKRMKVMPLVTNANFDKYLMSQLLADEDAQDDLIDDLIREARKRKFIGWQFDFENINHLERDLYVDFVKKASKAFEKKRLKLSVAVIPRETDYDATSTDQNWSSAYDIGALAEHVDFISLMSYDNPLSKGPVASIGYTTSVLNQALKDAPAEKLSLGIPFYCWQWNMTTGTKIANISYDMADGTKVTYKNSNYTRNYLEHYETEFFSFIKNGEYHNVWCDNERSIEAKLELAEEKGLYGTSAWALGQEDPKVWKHY